MLNNWLHRILNYKETPPDGVWKDIANKLDNDEQSNAVDFVEKIINFEVAPPDAAFTNIFDALDKEQNNSIEKIYNYSETPPSNAWENITAELDKEQAEKAIVIPIQGKRNNIRPIYKFAVAAAVIAIAVVAVLMNNKMTSVENNNTAGITPNVNTEKSNTITTTGVAPSLPAIEKNETKQPQNITQNTYKPVNIATTPNDGQYIKGNEVAEMATSPANTNEKLQNSNGQTPMDIGMMNSPNTYISITGPDGQSVKVSSKFSNLIEYLKGNNTDSLENIDVIINESAKWRATFAAWRDKMNHSGATPSLTNFMDIVELSNVLENNE
jgi:hypothetical protein